MSVENRFVFNKTYNEDSDVMMDQLIEENIKFDLILTDPPYDIKKDFGNNSDNLPIPEFLSITRERIKKCKQLLTPHGSLVWFGIHDYIGYIQVIMYESGLFYRRMNIWYYENGFSRNTRTPLAQYEPFLWFSNNKRKWTYNCDDVRVPYKSKKRLKTPVYYKGKNGEKKAWRPNPLGAMRGDIWNYPTLAGKLFKDEKTEHPTQKPESLITEIIKAFCPKSDNGKYEGNILDPFHGSGTLGACCEKLNKNGNNIQWMGIELEKRWCDIADARTKKIRST